MNNPYHLSKNNLTLCFLLFSFSNICFGQEFITLEKAISIALKNNGRYQTFLLQSDQYNNNIKTSFNPEKAVIYYNYDENNAAENNIPLKVFGLQQQFSFPTIYGTRKKLFKAEAQSIAYLSNIESRRLFLEVSKVYESILYLQSIRRRFVFLDSIHKVYKEEVIKRSIKGDMNHLDRLVAISQNQKFSVLLQTNHKDIETAYYNLGAILQDGVHYRIEDTEIKELTYEMEDSILHQPNRLYYMEALKAADYTIKLNRQALLPDIGLEYFYGTNGIQNPAYQGIAIGVNIPIFFTSQKAEINNTIIKKEALTQEKNDILMQLEAKKSKHLNEISKYRLALNLYHEEGDALKSDLFNTAKLALEEGEINFITYVQYLDQALEIEMEYLQNVYQYNLEVLELRYLVW